MEELNKPIGQEFYFKLITKELTGQLTTNEAFLLVEWKNLIKNQGLINESPFLRLYFGITGTY